MKNILLCTSDPLLTRNLYGALRDEGHAVETVEHPALAVQKVMEGSFDVLVLDSEPFGLSSEDAVQIIRSVKPALPIICVAKECRCGSAHAVETPIDLAAIKRTVHTIAA